MKKLMKQTFAITLGTMVLGASLSQAQTTTLYSDTFSGAGGLLNGVAVEGGAGAGTLWSANGSFRDNGSMDGTVEGSAILPFTPQLQHVYTLTLDVFNTTDRWIGLGFKNSALASPTGDNFADRFSNGGGISWMLYRDHATDPTQDIQIFAGPNTSPGIADANVTFDNAAPHSLKIVIDTSADLTGASFLADFFLDGTSVSFGPQTVSQTLANIQYVGMTFDDATTVTTITYDNFQLTATAVPEPATAALVLLGLGALAVARRRRD